MSFSIYFVSCTDESKENFEPADQNELQAEYLSIIRQLGFDEATAVDMGDYFIVEGDIILGKEDLSSYTPVTTRQARSEYIVGIPDRYDIKVKIETDVPIAWRTAFEDAVNEWNTFNGLKMTVASASESSPDITVYMSSLGSSVVAQASWPTAAGKPGPTIQVSTYFQNSFNAGEKKIIAVHELGHCLGLRHTNWSANNESAGIGIIGTPNTGNNPDPNSIMNYDIIINNRSWTEFSDYDKIAIETLYPTTWIDKGNGGCEYTFTQNNLPVPTTKGAISADPLILNFDVEFLIYKNGNEYGVDLQSRKIECKNPDDFNDMLFTLLSYDVRDILVYELYITYAIQIEYSYRRIPLEGQLSPPAEICTELTTFTTEIPICYF